MALTKAEYKTQQDRVEADYKVGKEKCSSLSANAKDICQVEAKGAEKVAKERCDAMSGNAKDACQNDAKAKFGMK